MTTTTAFEFGPMQRKILEVLRTTDARQTCKDLIKKDRQGHCCYCIMGIIAKDVLNLKVAWRQHGGKDEGYFLDAEGCLIGGRLPTDTLALLGMRLRHQEAMISLNDSQGMTFAQAADVIEASPEKYFNRTA